MNEIQLTQIKSLYGEIKGYFDSIDTSSSGPYIVPRSIGENYNTAVDELTQVSNTDYSRLKISARDFREAMNRRLVRSQMSALVTRLENEYGFGQETVTPSPGIVIFNKNENEISLKINYTINDLIDRSTDDEEKNKLTQLNKELSNQNKNWNKIKRILIWILNFSKDLFLKVIPIILQKYS